MPEGRGYTGRQAQVRKDTVRQCNLMLNVVQLTHFSPSSFGMQRKPRPLFSRGGRKNTPNRPTPMQAKRAQVSVS